MSFMIALKQKHETALLVRNFGHWCSINFGQKRTTDHGVFDRNSRSKIHFLYTSD